MGTGGEGGEGCGGAGNGLCDHEDVVAIEVGGECLGDTVVC